MELAREILSLRPGDHLCLFYEKDPHEQIPALVPFIQDGLSRDEQCVYIADDQTVEELESQLQQSGINVGEECKRGALKLWTRREWRQPGELSSEAKSRQVLGFINEAFQSGFKGSRFAVEMTWILGPDIGAEQLENWEATINTIFVPGFSGRIACQYNQSRLAPEALLAALHTHPQAILGDHVYANWFYQAPLILDGGAKSSAARVEWMLSVLKRSRATQMERDELIAKRAALAEAARLAAIVESSDDAIVSKDLNGIITSWNQGAERLFGYQENEVLGKSVTLLNPPDRYDEEPLILNRIRHGERFEHYETVRRRKDGSLIDISLTVSSIKDIEGKVIGVSKIARDITHRKQTEAALREARDDLVKANQELDKRVRERTVALGVANTALHNEIEEHQKLQTQLFQAQKMESIGTLAGGIAHEFNNTLNIIKGYVLLIRQHPKVDENLAENLNVIEEAVERGAYSVRQLLTLARKTESHFALSSLNDLLSELSKLLKQTFPKTIDITLVTDVNLPSLRVDANQIRQALLNLCVNARDAMAGGGKLTLKTFLADGSKVQDPAAATGGPYACIEVKDTGSGMDATVRQRIFEPFFTTKGVGTGTGLGLAISYGIVKNHGGFIDVDSQVGHGTSFRLYFPMARSEEEPAVDKTPTEEVSPPIRAKGGATVLIVEDEEKMVYLLRKALLRNEYKVLVASDGEQAIDLYHRRKQEIGVVLLDIGLPKIAGLDVILRMKEENPNVKVIVVSGYIDPDFKLKMQRAGVQGFVEKPYSPGDVICMMRAALESSLSPIASSLV